MIWMMLRRTATPVLMYTVLVLGGGFTTGCGALDVSDPTAIEGSELDNAAGADLLRGTALQALYGAVTGGALSSGILADEFFTDPSFSETGYALLDRRESVLYEQELLRGGYVSWQGVRRNATLAIPRLRAYALPGAAEAHVGEMFALRGFATLRLAEDICPGFPLHEVADLKPVYGLPLSTDEAFERALAEFDSALVYVADSARILNLARVGRGRALLGLGRFAEAAATTTLVPTEYLVHAEYADPAAAPGLQNELRFGEFGDLTRSVADREGANGLDFVTAGDPRVRTTQLGTARDGVTGVFAIDKYPSWAAPIVLASGVEARLIEAEAALDANPEDGAWLTILNALRTSCTPMDPTPCPEPAPAGSGGVDSLPLLTDPGTVAARVDLLFRERAFWLFATGHRLGDLRRLISRYGRSSESVFPTGAHRRGGVYGSATSIPFSPAVEAQFNPAVTGCTSR